MLHIPVLWSSLDVMIHQLGWGWQPHKAMGRIAYRFVRKLDLTCLTLPCPVLSIDQEPCAYLVIDSGPEISCRVDLSLDPISCLAGLDPG